ncbi:Uncharacterised protein [uncultured archaeon]|nr:Uncharacterised protein [uncultured archaeon]
METNRKYTIAFFILIVTALLVAGFLTFNLAKPKTAEKFYEQAFGFKPAEPEQDAVGKGIIRFKKTEE